MTTTNATPPTVTIQIGSTMVVAPVQLARLAGWEVHDNGTEVTYLRDHNGYATRRLARALSEGRVGEDALLRVIALAEEESAAQRREQAETRVAQLNAEAAREHAKAEAIRAKRERERV